MVSEGKYLYILKDKTEGIRLVDYIITKLCLTENTVARVALQLLELVEYVH